MRGRFLALLLLLAYIWLSEGSMLSDYERCKKEGFGDTVFVCDADEVLANSTRAKLTTLLKDLQTRIPCKCAKGCMRSSGSDKYMGVLLVTDSDKINDTAQPLNESAQEIYKDAELGNVDCQNGLLIIYIKDKQQLATYRGAGNFILLKSEDMSKLHSLATKSSSTGDDTLVLQYLLANYENVVMRSEIQRAETWTPMIGLSIALIIVLLILALLLALFLARFCCCCARSDKKEAYQVTTMPTYKTIEPLFIATSPHNERIHGPHSDVIYSTPYSGTPLPPPHFGAPRPDIYGGSVRSASVSQSATPVSTHKHRIRPVHGAIPRGFTPTGTPTSRSRRDSQHVDDFTQTNGHSTPVDSARRVERNSTASITQAVIPRASQETASVQRSIGYAESDLSFLDPRRKLEVQTRTDYIY